MDANTAASSAADAHARSEPDERDSTSGARGWITLGLLSLYYVISLMDRNILILLIEPIKHDLHLSDFEVSLLTGLAFSLTYSIAALPIGWAVDRFSRRGVIFSGLIVWSLATAACGLGRNFASLLVARAAVGVGEAAIAPASQSIISDTFPPNRLSLPMSLFGASTKLGVGVSFFVGGILIGLLPPSEVYVLPIVGLIHGWQLLFFVAGLPGLLTAGLIFLIREPSRPTGGAAAAAASSYSAYIKLFWTQRRFMLGVHLGQMLMLSTMTALMTWIAPFLARAYGWPPGKAGMVLGPVLTIGPLLCVPIHGILVDRAFGRGVGDAHLRHLSMLAICAAPLAATAFLAPSAEIALGCLCIVMMLLSAYIGLGNSALMISLPPEYRGKASSVLLLLNSVIGGTIGATAPTLIAGAISDAPAAIGVGVAIYCGTTLTVAAICYTIARRPMRERFRNAGPAAITPRGNSTL